MKSAWHSTPLDVYERHVELPSVGQAQAIREILAGAIANYSPQSLLYLGCAGGNGLSAALGIRVVALDLNPEYIAVACSRYPGVDLRTCDLNCELPEFAPVEMVFGALVFEYISDVPAMLRRLANRVAPGGRLIVPVLEADAGVPSVLPSPYLPALAPLSKEYKTLDPDGFVEEAVSAGFRFETCAERPLPSGKRFKTLVLRRD